jgi:hypothetical protein
MPGAANAGPGWFDSNDIANVFAEFQELEPFRARAKQILGKPADVARRNIAKAIGDWLPEDADELPSGLGLRPKELALVLHLSSQIGGARSVYTSDLSTFPSADGAVTYSYGAEGGRAARRRVCDKIAAFLLEDDEDTRLQEESPASSSPLERAATARADVKDLDAWARSSVEDLGRRRTGLPHDPSIDEIDESGLGIAAKFRIYRGPGAVEGPALRLNELASRTPMSRGTLILGPPGSGKSLAMYRLARAVDCTVLVLRPRDANALFRQPVYQPRVEALKAAARRGDRVVVMIDGLDEGLTSDTDADRLVQTIGKLQELGPVVVTCRLREYEGLLSTALAPLFERAYELQEWSASEFTKYVEHARRIGADGAALSKLQACVRSGQIPRSLTTRPLHARLLLSLDPSSLESVHGPYDLYEGYFAAVEAVAGSQQTRSARLRLRWLMREVGSRVRLLDLMVGDTFDYSQVVEGMHLSKKEAAEVRRLVALVADVYNEPPDEWGRFAHYSFYEFFAGSAFAHAVVAARKPAQVGGLLYELGQDLTREMRHFASEEIRSRWHASVSRGLVGAYQTSHDDPASEATLTRNNLIIYFLSRACADGAKRLRDLEVEETNSYLRCSISWARAHVGDHASVLKYVRELDESEEARAVARGQTLKYYGGLHGYPGPPFVDDRSSDARPTIARVCAMLTGPQYVLEIPSERWVIDLYTLYDLAISRDIRLSAKEAAWCWSILQRLLSGGVEESIAKRLLALHAVATS